LIDLIFNNYYATTTVAAGGVAGNLSITAATATVAAIDRSIYAVRPAS
jgi:hypothetical protein